MSVLIKCAFLSSFGEVIQVLISLSRVFMNMENQLINVMKFGGASICTPSAAKKVSDIIRASDNNTSSVIVFSAIGKTSSNLLKATNLSADGEFTLASNIINTLRELHFSFVESLVDRQIKNSLLDNLAIKFDELSDLIKNISTSEHFLKELDKILSYGEVCSCLLMSAILEDHGVKVCVINATDIIKTDNSYSKATLLHNTTNALIQQTIFPAIKDGKMIVTHGFIGSTTDGDITTLGFEGSDYTATILGSALDCCEVQLWKTVDGIMSADPNIIALAHTVPVISYNEAKELSTHGASCLHPKAMEPIQSKGIPVRILNVIEPGHTGTLITDRKSDKKSVKSITYKHGSELGKKASKASITLVGEGMLFEQDVTDEINEILSEYEIFHISTSENAISMTFEIETIMLLEVLEKTHEYFFNENAHPRVLFSVN